MKQKAIYPLLIVCLAFGANFLSGCKDDKIVDPGTHFEPEGIVITAAGDTIVYYFQGVVRAGDTLKAPAGDNLSPHYSLQFINANRNPIALPSTSTHQLGWTIAHNNIAEIYRDPGDEWDFHVRGKEEGNTTIVLRVLHGGHSDFVTQPIPVSVDSSFVGEAAGIMIIEEETGDTVAMATSSGVSGSFAVQKDSTTDHHVLYFLDAEGISFQPPVPPHSMGFTVLNTSVADLIPAGAAEPWAFQVTGNAVGSTKVRFKLIAEGVEEFVSFDIDITVNP